MHNVGVLLICRWRDVKLCAFDGAKHRTYVDLKVKVYLLVPFSVISLYGRKKISELIVSS